MSFKAIRITLKQLQYSRPENVQKSKLVGNTKIQVIFTNLDIPFLQSLRAGLLQTLGEPFLCFFMPFYVSKVLIGGFNSRLGDMKRGIKRTDKQSFLKLQIISSHLQGHAEPKLGPQKLIAIIQSVPSRSTMGSNGLTQVKVKKYTGEVR